MRGKYYEEESRASDEIDRAPCKGGPTRGDQCEMDGRRAARCWRHHHRVELAARLAYSRVRKPVFGATAVAKSAPE